MVDDIMRCQQRMMSSMIWSEVGGDSLALGPSLVVVIVAFIDCRGTAVGGDLPATLYILQFSISSSPGPDFHSNDSQTQHFECFPFSGSLGTAVRTSRWTLEQTSTTLGKEKGTGETSHYDTMAKRAREQIC